MNGFKSGVVQLGAQRVEIRIVPALYKEEELFGDADCAKNVIRIAGDIVATQAAETLLHEITHFLIGSSLLSAEVEEFVVSAISGGLSSLFRDNSELVKSITKVFREEATKCRQKSTHKRKQTARTRTKRPLRRQQRLRRT